MFQDRIVKCQLSQDLADIGRLLYEKRLTIASGGNMSVRSEGSMLITPSGVCKGMLSAEDIIEIDISSGEIIGKGKPSIETPFHLGIYRSRPDVNAVIHCHPVSCTVLAIQTKDLRTNLTPESLMILGKDVPMIPYDTPGSDGLAEKLISVMGSNTACIMQNHGALVVGKSLMDAFFRMETLEYIATLQLKCGEVPGLPEDEIERVLAMSK